MTKFEQMEVLHISMECYPAAKTGGLADVVGSLPKYLNRLGVDSSVVIPRYDMKWLNERSYSEVFRGHVRLDQWNVPFRILKIEDIDPGFSFYTVDSNHHFYRQGVYSDRYGYYGDEVERYLVFQQAVLHWVKFMEDKPYVLHCHDHHTALIPYFIKYCPEYESLSHLETVLTIHNGAYQGAFSWKKINLLPWFRSDTSHLLDWGGAINPLASGIRCSSVFTTVSGGYLNELQVESGGLEHLIRSESYRSAGILNGIDYEVWNPATDPVLISRLGKEGISGFKEKNKEPLVKYFDLNPKLPLVTFIGRLVREKGADLLPDLIQRVLHAGINVSFFVLGTGDRFTHNKLLEMRHKFPDNFNLQLEYNEDLAHQLYAGSDFILMPSRVEPCGLNQMYAMRYGTVPIVRAIGGLRDSVPDIGLEYGRGIQYTHFTIEDAGNAIYRANELFWNKPFLEEIRNRIINVDLSWDLSAKKYIDIYHKITN